MVVLLLIVSLSSLLGLLLILCVAACAATETTADPYTLLDADEDRSQGERYLADLQRASYTRMQAISHAYVRKVDELTRS